MSESSFRMTILTVRHDSDDLAADFIAEILLGVLAKWLTSFRCGDAFQSDPDCALVRSQDVDRIAVDDADDFDSSYNAESARTLALTCLRRTLLA